MQLKKRPAYFSHISTDASDRLRQGIIDLLISRKGYKDKQFTARRMAELLNTNSRYVSIAVQQHFHMNYTSLLNKLRTEEVMTMLADPNCADMALQEIADAAGFSNRQTFYSAFRKHCGMTPAEYRETVKG